MRSDTITKNYGKNAGVFANIFNFYIYDGRQVLLPEQLAERDSAKISLSYGANGAVVSIQKFRDVIPSITATIFFGSGEWDGSLSLFEMMDLLDPDE